MLKFISLKDNDKLLHYSYLVIASLYIKGVPEMINNYKIPLGYISASGDQIFIILVITTINPSITGV